MPQPTFADRLKAARDRNRPRTPTLQTEDAAAAERRRIVTGADEPQEQGWGDYIASSASKYNPFSLEGLKKDSASLLDKAMNPGRTLAHGIMAVDKVVEPADKATSDYLRSTVPGIFARDITRTLKGQGRATADFINATGGAVKDVAGHAYDAVKPGGTGARNFQAAQSGFRGGAEDSLRGLYEDPLSAVDPGFRESFKDPEKTLSQKAADFTVLGFEALAPTRFGRNVVGRGVRSVERGVAGLGDWAERQATKNRGPVVGSVVSDAMEQKALPPPSARFYGGPGGLGTVDDIYPSTVDTPIPESRPLSLPPRGGTSSANLGRPGQRLLPGKGQTTDRRPTKVFISRPEGVAAPGGAQVAGVSERYSPVPVSSGMGGVPAPQMTPAQRAFEALVPERLKGEVTPEGLTYSLREPATPAAKAKAKVAPKKVAPPPPPVIEMVEEAPVVVPPKKAPKAKAAPKVAVAPPIAEVPATPTPGATRMFANSPIATLEALAKRGNKHAIAELGFRKTASPSIVPETPPAPVSAAPKAAVPPPAGPPPVISPEDMIKKVNAEARRMVRAGEAMDMDDARTIIARASEQPRPKGQATRPAKSRLGSETGAVGRDIEQRRIISDEPVPNDPDPEYSWLDRLKGRAAGALGDEEGAIKFKNMKDEDFHDMWRRMKRARPTTVHPEFAQGLLMEAGEGPPGLSKGDPTSRYTDITYRGPDGQPVVTAQLVKMEDGTYGVSGFGANPKLKGNPLMGKAMHKLSLHMFDEMGVRGPFGSISDDTRNFITKLVTRGTGLTPDQLDAMIPPEPARPTARRHPISQAASAGQAHEAIARLRRQLDVAGLQRISDDTIREMAGQENNRLSLQELRRDARARAIADGRDPDIYGPPDPYGPQPETPPRDRWDEGNPDAPEPYPGPHEGERPRSPDPYPEAELNRVRDRLAEQERAPGPNPERSSALEQPPDGELDWDYERWLDEQARRDAGRERATQQRLEEGQRFLDAKDERENRQRIARGERPWPPRRSSLLGDERGAVGKNIGGPRRVGQPPNPGAPPPTAAQNAANPPAPGGARQNNYVGPLRAVGPGGIVRKGVKEGFDIANQVRIASMLSGWALPKSLLGNVGSAGIATIENLAEGQGFRQSVKPLRELARVGKNLQEFKAGWKKGANPQIAGSANYGKYNPITRTMGAADHAATEMLMRSGKTLDEAQRYLLTSPKYGLRGDSFTMKVGGRNVRVPNPVADYFVPFRRTPFNSFLGTGETMMKHPALSAGAAVAGAGAGSLTDDPRALGLMSALMGPYGMLFGIGAGTTAGARAIQGLSPIPEWSIAKSLGDPLHPFTTPSFFRMFKEPGQQPETYAEKLRKKRKAPSRKPPKRNTT